MRTAGGPSSWCRTSSTPHEDDKARSRRQRPLFAPGRFRGNAYRGIGPLPQPINGRLVIQSVTLPASNSRAWNNPDLPRLIGRDELDPVELSWSARYGTFECLPIPSDEPECSIIEHLHDAPAFMQLATMEAVRCESPGRRMSVMASRTLGCASSSPGSRFGTRSSNTST
jgi:hypothetical protein